MVKPNDPTSVILMRAAICGALFRSDRPTDHAHARGIAEQIASAIDALTLHIGLDGLPWSDASKPSPIATLKPSTDAEGKLDGGIVALDSQGKPFMVPNGRAGNTQLTLYTGAARLAYALSKLEGHPLDLPMVQLVLYIAAPMMSGRPVSFDAVAGVFATAIAEAERLDADLASWEAADPEPTV